MHKVNEMVFTADRYETVDEMWEDIKRFIKLLLSNDYTMVIRDDDVDIIVIEYEHNELVEPWGCANPHWLTEEEAYSIEQLNKPDNKENEDSEFPFL